MHSYTEAQINKYFYSDPATMILNKKRPEADRPSTNTSGHKTFYSFSVTPGKTNYIFKKIKPVQQIEVNCISNFKSARDEDSLPTHHRCKNNRNFPELKIEASTEVSCTSFMKSYVEKLKKQRKRQNKKLRDSRNQKQIADKLSLETKTETLNNDIYLAKQMDHIFVLERVPRKGQRKNNTISLIEEQTNDIQQLNFFKEKLSKWEEPAWANKERIDNLIRQIRNSRNIIEGGDQKNLIEEDSREQKTSEGPNLPTIGAKQREIKSRAKSKEKSRGDFNFKALEPWKQDQNIQEFSIQEYNVKNSEQF